MYMYMYVYMHALQIFKFSEQIVHKVNLATAQGTTVMECHMH